MANPTFDSFSLQDDTYITSNVKHHIRAKRNIQTTPITRRSQRKFVNEQLQEKVITVKGHIITSTVDAMQTAIDNMFRYTSGVEKTLTIESGRDYKATAEKVDVEDRNFTKTMAPFEIDFISAKPYSEGTETPISFVVISGLFSYSLSTTISGTFLNRPVFTFTLPSGTGTSPINIIKVLNFETANEITVSGTFTAESDVVLNYDDYSVTVGGTETDYTGQFDDISVGESYFTITVSGSKNDGTRVGMAYNPRYW